MSERGIRNLAHLQNSASTARVLNLLCTWSRHKGEPDYAQQPFFQNTRLNRAMILKHRLRRDEMDFFGFTRLTATKIVFPVDPNDLRLGGRFVFVGQRNFTYLLQDEIGRNEQTEKSDMALLSLLDTLPSLDPFLLREELKRNGYNPATCYLELSNADLAKIFDFVKSEIEPLILMSLGNQSGLTVQSDRLVEKILSNTLDAELQPLRQVLQLTEPEFAEGVFCWKGFLYYKWVYTDLAEVMPKVIRTIIHAKALGKQEGPISEHLERVRIVLVDRILAATEAIGASLDVYEHAYVELTKKGNAIAFRDFLRKSPTLFAELGEILGVIQHIRTFCDFRFPAGQMVSVSSDELADIFNDFEGNLFTLDRYLEPGENASHIGKAVQSPHLFA